MRFRMNPYYEQMILNADPLELVNLIYKRAISCVIDAREHLERKRIVERSKAIMRAYASIEQLILALRPEAAPELCGRLHSLYAHMQQRLLDANMQQADQPLAEVLGLLTTLAEGWSGVADQMARPADAAGEAKTGPWPKTRQATESKQGYAVTA